MGEIYFAAAMGRKDCNEGDAGARARWTGGGLAAECRGGYYGDLMPVDSFVFQTELFMANPLQMLPLVATGFQFLQEIAVNAPPPKVWSAVTNPGKWFFFNPDPATHAKHTFDLRPGGQWTSQSPNGNSSLLATVLLIEPGTLLRLSGPIGLSHLPLSTVVIFELMPQDGGKSTLLKVCMRSSGLMDAEVENRYKGAWQRLLPQIKAAAEG
jgi:uncharacterized protein YndB with AHSA1/START domain